MTAAEDNEATMTAAVNEATITLQLMMPLYLQLRMPPYLNHKALQYPDLMNDLNYVSNLKPRTLFYFIINFYVILYLPLFISDPAIKYVGL